MDVKDFRGVPITKGAVVVYPVRQSSSMWMNEGIVEDVIVKTHDWGFRKGQEYALLKVRKTKTWIGDIDILVTISVINRVVVVKTGEGILTLQ